MLNKKQIESIKYYEGDVPKKYPLYLNDNKAYNVLNSLLFPSNSTELARTKEHRYLNPNLLANPRWLIDYYQTLLSCFHPANQDIIAYRVERLADYQIMKQYQKLPSFISTSTACFLNNYLDKCDLVLMVFHINKNNQIINFAGDLDKYQKKEEQEILLKPGTKIKITERTLSSKELAIKDLNNNPPRVICDVYLEDVELVSKKVFFINQHKVPAMLYLNDLNNQLFDSKYFKNYIKYKNKIQKSIGLNYDIK